MLDRVHKLSEIVAAFAIVGSLIFVGVQVSQNTSALQNNAAQNNAMTWQAITLAQATNTKLAEVMRDGLRAPNAPDIEQTQRYYLFVTTLKSIEFNHHQWLEGNLSDELWAAARRGFILQVEKYSDLEVMLETPIRRTFTERFVAFWEEAVAEAKGNLAAQGANKTDKS